MARGIHVEALPVVINLDLPDHAPVYVHRIGRTARAGQSGLAISPYLSRGWGGARGDPGPDRSAPALAALAGFPVTDKPASGESKRAPRDKQANRRTQGKRSIKQFRANPETDFLPRRACRREGEERSAARRGAPNYTARGQSWNWLIRRERFCSRSTSRVMPSRA